MAAIGFGIVALASIQAALSAVQGARALMTRPWRPAPLASVIFRPNR